jgi:phosphoglycerate dehydrogenase-like enzyme
MKVYVDYALSPEARAILARVAGGDEVWTARDSPASQQDRAAFMEAEVAFGEVPTDLLSQARHLRWIQLPSVGLDYYRSADWGELAPRITCTNMKGVFTEAVIQTTLAGILGLYRGIDRLVRLQARHDWQKLAVRPHLKILRGSHVLILGAGDLARGLREPLSRFGCSFTFYARTSGDIHTLAQLDAALATADIVCAALPDTAETRGLIDRTRLSRFKPGAFFVNIGRGSLTDEAALVDALRAGRLAGAVLDVTQNEPLNADDILWDAPNVLLTQHTAAGSDRLITDSIEFFGENLGRYRRREPLLNVVDWSKKD